jgi:hypothetical protein
MKSNKTEALWQTVAEIVRRSPQQAAALELETHAYILLTLLDFEISSSNLVAIYHSAIEGESLEWLIDRLNHEQFKHS